MLLVSNIVLFQIGWFACVLLGDVWALLIAASIVVVHCLYVVPSARIKVAQELQWLIVVLLVGFCVELFFFGNSILVREDGSNMPPLWLLCLWVLFATTMRFSLAWLQRRLLLAAAFAFVSGPSSYYAGAHLSESVYIASNIPIAQSLFVIGVVWAFVFPLLMYLSSRYQFSNSQQDAI